MSLLVRIDRCVCQRLPFAVLLPLARAGGWSEADVIRATGCGDQCGMCRPYLRQVLATGETIFTQVLEDEA